MKNYSELKKNTKNNFLNLKPLKVAILGDSSTQFLVIALRGTGFDTGFDLQILDADFNQVQRQIFDTSSELYEFKPEIIIVFQSSHKLLEKYNKLMPEHQGLLAESELKLINELTDIIKNNLSTNIIYFNYPEIDDAVYGSFSNKIESSFLFQLRKLNYELMHFAIKNNHFFICDLSSIQNQIGKQALFQPSIYINAEMVLSIDVLPIVAQKTIDIINALNGKIKKCVILDLDNTTWGGIIGDDGIENIQIGMLGIGKAFSEFQYWIKKLQNRGIIVAVCSKNTESIAKEPFEKHPEMVLRLSQIAVFIANWNNKADNIRLIQNILNIGFDSMVFLDDNPFERNIVRQNIPAITVPELPEDPAEYLEYIYTLNLFETVSISKEDSERTKLYQTGVQRNNLKLQFANENDYLKSLEMYSVIEPFNKFNIPRVAQLSQRSNQLNLRTIRYNEANLEKLSKDKEYFTFTFTLADKYGDNGLISVIIILKEDAKTAFICAWFMSCRVLKRGMEKFSLNTIAIFLRKKGFAFLKGEFIPTNKNEMVKNHFRDLGFEDKGEYWFLSLDDYEPKPNFIKKK